MLAEQGCIVEPVAPPFPGERLWEAWVVLRQFANLGARKALHDDPETRAMMKPEAVWEIEGGLALTPIQIHAASVTRSDWYAALAGLFSRHDALALPAAQVFPFDKRLRHPASIAGRIMDTYHRWMEVVVPASLAGLPAIAVPAGFRGGRPAGLQIAGPHGGDSAVLQLGHAYHRATDWPGRRPPPA